jgi:hypothetical protein
VTKQQNTELCALADELDKAVIRREFATWSGVASRLRQISEEDHYNDLALKAKAQDLYEQGINPEILG